MRLLFVQDNGLNESLAITDVSSVLKQKGVDTDIVLTREENLGRYVKINKPEVVVIAAGIFNCEWALSNAKIVKSVFRKAKVNKASKIYEHGISLEKTAKLLGVTMWELQVYAGQKSIHDAPLTQTMNTKSRIKLAMEMFG